VPTKSLTILRPLLLGVLAGAAIGITVCQAAERTIAVARSDCRLAIEQVAAPGVEYQPGIDVHGAPVAPADVEEPDVVLPDVIPISISADLVDQFQLPPDSPLLNVDAGIGIVEFQLSSGRLYFNGIELSETDEQALAASCREALPPR
jgi:hypothetical protein